MYGRHTKEWNRRDNAIEAATGDPDVTVVEAETAQDMAELLVKLTG